MKLSIYSEIKNIYGAGEMLNLRPVAFDYVPENKRGMNRMGRSGSGR